MGEPRGRRAPQGVAEAPGGDARVPHADAARLRDAEEALRWARHAADAVSEAIFRLDESGRFLDVNRAACEMHGWSREELLTMRVADIDASPYGTWADFWSRLRQERRLVFENTNRRRDGSLFTSRIDASLLEHDGVEQCVGVVHDLSEQKRHEALVFEIARGLSATTGRTFFRSLLEHLVRALEADHAFVGELVPGNPGRARTIARVADGAEQPNVEYDLAGTPCGTVVGSSLCTYPRGVQELFPDDLDLVEHGVSGYAGIPLFHSSGAPLGLLAIMTRKPIERVAQAESLLQIFGVRAAVELERLQAEQALRQSESLLRNVIDHTKAVVFVKRADGRYLHVNREFERVVGVTVEQVRDRTDHEVLPSEVADAVRANDLEVLRRRESIQYEEVVPGADGVSRTYLSIKFPLFDDAGEAWAVCGIATDITERLTIESQLREVQRLESVGLLAGGIAHDFNNLLTAIQGYTDLALHDLGPAHPAREMLAEAQNASRRATVLTRQLLTFARRQPTAPRRVELQQAVAEVSALVRPLLGERVKLLSRFEPDLWTVHVDAGQLEQVLVSLAVNARDAMPGGGVIECTAANVALRARDVPPGSGLAPGDYVRLEVADTGVGMPADVVARVFEPFFTTKGPGKGTGLGLATAHGIVRQSGGHIGVQSEPGKGTRFTLLLPRSVTAVPEAGGPPRAALTPGQGTVLLVEDEPIVRALAARALRASGYVVHEAASGEEALALVTDGGLPFDLLLTDVVMPGISGPDLAERIADLRPEVAVLFTTGYTEGGLHERLRASNATVIEKPYAPSVLTTAVRAALAAKA